MSYHIISVDHPDCRLSVKHGQLCLHASDLSKQIPLEDVAAIIITSIKCTFSNHFITEVARKRISVIICDTYKPAALILPADRATDTHLIRNIANLSSQLKNRLWDKTLNAKCNNQFASAISWAPEHPLLHDLERLSKSRKISREAECAKLYWTIFSDTFFNGQFRRDRSRDDCNVLFNYAYAILLSCVLRNLFALGLDPTFGIFHSTREHATPLAYDLMEPFRIAFDMRIAHWIQQYSSSDFTISQEFRSYILETLLLPVFYNDKSISLKSAIELSIRSFRAAIHELQSGPYSPWTISTTKWDG